MSIATPQRALYPDPASLDPAPETSEAESIDLLRIVALFVAEWRTGLLIAVIAFAITGVAVAFIHEQYEANAVILPKEASPVATGNLSALFGGFRPSSAYGSLLVSRTLRNDVIRRANLQPYFRTPSPEAARNILAEKTRLIFNPDNTISIQIRDRDAGMAAKMANTYVDALRSMQETMATTQNDLQRRYFEQQLGRERDALARAEDDLEKMQVGSGVVQIDTQTQIGLNAIATTRAQITTLQVQLAALLQSATEQNPEVKTLRTEIAQLEAHEHGLENGPGGTGAGAPAPAGRVPRLALEYTRKLREVRFHEALVTSLANHFEGIRLGGSGISDSFDLIDQAVVPEAPTWPPRRNFYLFALGASLLAGLLAIALRLVARRVLADPAQRAHLDDIRRNVRGRR